MAAQTSIIKIFTYSLPYKLSNQIYKEFQSRLSEADSIIEKSDRYAGLPQYQKTVELLLAMSIFEKRSFPNNIFKI